MLSREKKEKTQETERSFIWTMLPTTLRDWASKDAVLMGLCKVKGLNLQREKESRNSLSKFMSNMCCERSIAKDYTLLLTRIGMTRNLTEAVNYGKHNSWDMPWPTMGWKAWC